LIFGTAIDLIGDQDANGFWHFGDIGIKNASL
jgi:hypothetical protein